MANDPWITEEINKFNSWQLRNIRNPKKRKEAEEALFPKVTEPDNSKQKADELLAELEAEKQKAERDRQKRKEKKLKARQKKRDAQQVESIFTTMPPEKPVKPVDRSETESELGDFELVSSYEPQDLLNCKVPLAELQWQVENPCQDQMSVASIREQLDSHCALTNSQLRSMAESLLQKVQHLEARLI